MNKVLERMSKQAALTYMKVLSYYLPEGTKWGRMIKKTVSIAEIKTWGIPNAKQ
jgi:hypothetical protein